MCSGKAYLDGLGLVPLAIKRLPIGSPAQEALVLAEIDALKAVSGAEHIIQLVDFKFSQDRSTCFVITRWAAGTVWVPCTSARLLACVFYSLSATPLPHVQK